MEFTSRRENDMFLAVALSIFTFSFMFLGVKMHMFYLITGFASLLAAVKYWVKLKKDPLKE